ncbi:MAG TPA: helix-turn-helix transcriptional regulator, partial [Ardenticatenaceae bacterium]|nr:helix-turn-helix transcriptional regulator [Ardenticatenaceae bacterium]
MARPERPVDPEAGPVQRLAYELRQLRLAAGRPSYRQLSTRAHFSASMLSEAAGGTVLPSLAVTLAYVKACGGDPEEWERRWRVAAEVTSVPGVGEAAARAGTLTPAIGSGRSGPSLGPTASATPMEATPPVEAHFVSPVATSEGPSKRRSTRGRIMRLVAMTTVLTIVMTSMVTASHRPDNRLSKAAGQWIPGPAWANAPDRLPSKFFGVTLNSNSGAMPTFDVGAVRLWDSRTRWSNIEARRGEYNWFILDRMVAGATQAGLPVLLTFGGTPEWASPDGPRTPYDDGSRTSPPHDLSDWDRFVAAVAARYQGRI